MLALRIVLAVLCVSALGLAGCGGGGGTSYKGTKPDTWAADVCGALSKWAQRAQASSASLNTELRRVRDLRTVKAKLVTFLQNARTSAATLSSQVKAAGAPAVKDGEKLQSDLEADLERIQASFTRATVNAKTLSTRNAQAFSNGMTALVRQVGFELGATHGAFKKLGTKYKSTELDKATSEAPACSKISGS